MLLSSTLRFLRANHDRGEQLDSLCRAVIQEKDLHKLTALVTALNEFLRRKEEAQALLRSGKTTQS